MPVIITIPKGTDAELNGIPVLFTESGLIEFPVESIDHVAELAAAGGLKIDLSHVDAEGRIVRYGANGKKFFVEREKPVKKVAAVEKVKAVKEPKNAAVATLAKVSKPKAAKAKAKK